MSRVIPYVDTLGFVRDVAPPLFDEITRKNVLESGVKLIQLTSAWPMQNWPTTLASHKETVRWLNQHLDVFQIVLNRTDLQRLSKTDKIGVILTVQDPTCIGENLDRVHIFFEEGVRVMQVAFQAKNQNGCGFMVEGEDTGLTKTGRRFVSAVNEVGAILDLSHLAPKTALDCISTTTGPIMISHTAARGVYDHPRGTADVVLRTIASHDPTIVGIFAMTFFLDPEENGLGPMVKHIDYVTDIIGPSRVAIGSDGPVGGFTDLKAAETMFYEKTKKLRDPNDELRSRWPTHIPEFSNNSHGFRILGDALSKRFSPQEVAEILGGNAWRFFERSLPPA
jgi:membrane dipeptidase